MGDASWVHTTGSEASGQVTGKLLSYTFGWESEVRGPSFLVSCSGPSDDGVGVLARHYEAALPPLHRHPRPQCFLWFLTVHSPTAARAAFFQHELHDILPTPKTLQWLLFTKNKSKLRTEACKTTPDPALTLDTLPSDPPPPRHSTPATLSLAWFHPHLTFLPASGPWHLLSVCSAFPWNSG